MLPALIADLGEDASWRYTEFFSANISNPNTRRAYARACLRFLAWCDERGLTLTLIRPHDVATYIAEGLAGASEPSPKIKVAILKYADRPGGVPKYDMVRLLDFGDRIGEMTVADARPAWTEWLSTRGANMAPATAARSRAILQAALNYAGEAMGFQAPPVAIDGAQTG